MRQILSVSAGLYQNGPEGMVARRFAGVNALCSTCHADVWASFQRPFRHRLPEGGMSCVGCHNPHGSFLPRLMQTVNTNEPGCFKCHGASAKAPIVISVCMAPT